MTSGVGKKSYPPLQVVVGSIPTRSRAWAGRNWEHWSSRGELKAMNCWCWNWKHKHAYMGFLVLGVNNGSELLTEFCPNCICYHQYVLVLLMVLIQGYQGSLQGIGWILEQLPVVGPKCLIPSACIHILMSEDYYPMLSCGLYKQEILLYTNKLQVIMILNASIPYLTTNLNFVLQFWDPVVGWLLGNWLDFQKTFSLHHRNTFRKRL